MGKTTDSVWFGLAGAALGVGVGWLLYLFVSPAIGGECGIICRPDRAMVAGAVLGALGGIKVARSVARRRPDACRPRAPESARRRRQRIALWTGALVALVMTVYPPWTITRMAEGGQVTLTSAHQYHVLWRPPRVDERGEAVGIDLGRLLAQYFAVVALTAVAAATARDEASPPSVTPSDAQKGT